MSEFEQTDQQYQVALKTSRSLENLTNYGYFLNANKLSGAIPIFLEALDHYLGIHEIDSVMFGKSKLLNELGCAYFDIKDIERAKQYLTKAFSIGDKLPMKGANYFGETLRMLGNLSALENNSKQAINHFSRALAHARACEIESDKETVFNLALVLSSFASLLVRRDPFQSEEYFRESVQLFREIGSNSEKYVVHLAMALTNFAVLRKQSQFFEDAESLYEESLVIRRRLVDSNPRAYSEDLAFTLANLGNILQMKRDLRAKKLLEESLSVRRDLAKSFPDRYRDQVADVLHNLAILYYDEGHLSKAVETMEEVIFIF